MRASIAKMLETPGEPCAINLKCLRGVTFRVFDKWSSEPGS